MPLYDPAAAAREVSQPTLVVPCKEDQIFVWKAKKNKFAKRAPRELVTIAELEGGEMIALVPRMRC